MSLLVAIQGARASCPADLVSASPSDLPGGFWPLGCASDDPDRPEQCDWKVTVKEDVRVAADRRLVLVSSGHLTGCGSRQILAVFACISEQVVAVVREEYTNGARVERLEEKDLVVVSGAWDRSDPMCCPSGELRQTFSWIPTESRYILRRSEQIRTKRD